LRFDEETEVRRIKLENEEIREKVNNMI